MTAQIAHRAALQTFTSARLLELGSLAQRHEPAPARCVLVGRNPALGWVVKDSWGMLGGIFRSAGGALRFAKKEAARLHCAVVVENGPLEPG